MKLRFLATLAVAALSMAATSTALADDSKAYTEGPVVVVTSIRTKPGMFDAYMKWLDTTGKQLRDEQKKAGLILDYAVYSANPRSPNDPDPHVPLRTSKHGRPRRFGRSRRTHRRRRSMRRAMHPTRAAASDRESLREILGAELITRLELKIAGGARSERHSRAPSAVADLH